MVDMFPYGNGRQMPSGDDNLSDAFHLSQEIYYFGEPIKCVYVSINGYVAMGNNFSSYIPDPLTSHSLVAPFFTDVDTRKAGQVWYREDRQPGLLDKAAREVQNTKQASPDFRPSILFIATWSGVGYFNSKSDKRNTFQAVIASNGAETHVLLYYASINWTSPDNMNGEYGRLKGSDKSKLPVLGVGDGRGREHRVCGQDEGTILRLPSSRGRMSGKNGLWIFVVSKPGTTKEKISKAGDEDAEVADFCTTNRDFPDVLLFGDMIVKTFGPEGGILGDPNSDFGLMIEVPKGAVSDVLTVESRVGFGGPFHLDEYIESISKPYFITEKSPTQTLKKDITITLKHSAHLPTREDKDSVFFVCFSSNLTNGVYVSKVIDGSEARFQVTDQYGELKLNKLNKNCHIMAVKRVKKDPKLTAKEASKQEMKSTLKFMASFYNASVHTGAKLQPFSMFCMYTDDPIHQKKAEHEVLKELKASGVQLMSRNSDWRRNSNCYFDSKSECIAITSSMHLGWEEFKSHAPQILWDDLWAQRQSRETSGVEALKHIKCQQSLWFMFSKIPQSRLYYKKCTVSANGFMKKVQTDVLLQLEEVLSSREPTLMVALRTIMQKLGNGFQVSNFAVCLGIDHSTVERMKMGYGNGEIDKDRLLSYILELHSYIGKNSKRLMVDEEKVCKALKQIEREDLAEEFSQKLRDLEPDSMVADSTDLALYLPELSISERTRSRGRTARHASLTEEDAPKMYTKYNKSKSRGARDRKRSNSFSNWKHTQ